MRRLGRDGFSVPELLVTFGLFGLVATISMPSMLTYWQSATLGAGARELQTVLNTARQLAIRQNTSVCVERGGARVRFYTNGCAGTLWLGPGTDAAGWMKFANGVEIADGPAASVVFSALGGATPAGTYTVRNQTDTTQTLTVTVAASGRVTIP